MNCYECKRPIKETTKFCPYCGAKQAHYKESKNGNSNYNKVYIGIIAIVVVIVALFLFKTNTSVLEKSAVPLVDQILQNQYDLDYSCESVIITDKLGDNKYSAKAELDDGSAINITIEHYPKKDKIYVQIPYQEVLFLQ